MPSPENEEFDYTISVHDFDASLLPAGSRTPGTDAFNTAVTAILERDFAGFGGWARIVVDHGTIRVAWRPNKDGPKPADMVIRKIEAGDRTGAIRLLDLMIQADPDDAVSLYNLGMLLSDAGDLDRATEVLGRLLRVSPDDVNGRVALGVALARQGKATEAVSVLLEAVDLDPANPWAHRNLGGCLLKAGDREGAERHLRRAVELAPRDQQALFGLAQALLAKGEAEDADDLLVKVIDIDGRSEIAEAAKQARSRLSQETLRRRTGGGPNMAAVMYILGAMDKMEGMSKADVRKVAFEIAIMGTKGIDPNDPAQKYELRSLPGRYSGLHLLCLMFVGFKIVSPEHSIGFDLSREHEAAVAMRGAGGQGKA